MPRAVFLDRDGTINVMVSHPGDSPDSPAAPEEFALLPGAAEAIRRINMAGYLTLVVSNQPGIAKGKLTGELLEAITRKMHQELARAGAHLDAVLYCVHHPQATLESYRISCECRKPKPGLLLRGAAAFQVNLRNSYMIGDTARDVVAGAAAGCRTVWLGERASPVWAGFAREAVEPDHIAAGLHEAVDIILREG